MKKKILSKKIEKENIESSSIPTVQKLNVLDLFCGCGGMTKGLVDAGLNVIAGIDVWDKAIESYKKNHHHTAICADLTQYSPERFDEEYNKDKKEITIVVGGPPCFIEGTKVLTDTGYKNIENIELDEKLLTHTGQFQNIINLQRKNYTGELYELDIKYHPEIITCTEEHPFYIRTMVQKWDNKIRRYRNEFKEPEWKNAKDLTLYDYYGMVINTNNVIPEFEFERKINQSTTIKEKIILDDIDYWYMMGYFVGDGWIEETKKRDKSIRYLIKFAINNADEEEVFFRISKILKITDQKVNSGKCKKFGCQNFIWHNILKQFGKYAYGKIIPEWVHNAPKEYIEEFIKGYMKADGCIGIKNKSKYHKITTVSYNLAYGLQRLYLKIGIISSVKKTIKPKTYIIEGRTVNQRNVYNVIVYTDKIKSYSSFIENNYVWFKPFKIMKKSVENIPVYNFEVENDNSYIVQNTIVHNCQSFSMAGARDPNDPRSSLFMEFVRYLNYFSPKAFMMENVIGILSAKTASGENVIDIIMNLLEVNYTCVICKLYASDFEVPQNRRRVIIFGIRKDLQITPQPPTPVITSIENRIPVRTVLLPQEEVDRSYYLSDRALEGIRRKKEKSKENGSGFGAQMLDMDKPSFTIPARYWKDGYDALVKYSDTEIRRLTVLELQRIQSFPDDYIFEGSKKDKIMQIGNAVACRFAYHLGIHLIQTLQQ